MRSLLIAAAFTVVGCSTSGSDVTASGGEVAAARQVPETARGDAAAVVLANNQFACDLYADLASSDGNLVFSPFSISTALAMLDAGAAGATEREIRAALHAGSLGDRLHAGYHALIDSLDVGRGFGNYTLSTADRLFGQTGFPFRPEYLTTTRQQYDAELQPLDFQAGPESARDTINGWVAEHTAQAIPELFPTGAIDSDTVLALVNAIAFKGSWAQKFDTDATRDEPFQLADGTTINVPMMHKSDTVTAAALPGGGLFDLPFAGNDISLIVLVPSTAAGLPAIEAQLSATAIPQWIASAHRSTDPASFSFPRFTTKYGPHLETVLGKLGIVSAFDSNTADLSGIDGKTDLYVGAALHQATLAVDELGGQAAAATGVAIERQTAGFFVTVDRPFVFLLYDHVTGAILFLGRIVDPTRG
jgi:serpin B